MMEVYILERDDLQMQIEKGSKLSEKILESAQELGWVLVGTVQLDGMTYAEAINYAYEYGTLPKCEHGYHLIDWSFEILEPPCGCRPTPQQSDETVRRTRSIER